MVDKRIGFIGAGNMAQTIINGLIRNYTGINEKIYISNRTRAKGESLRNKFNVNLCESNIELVKNCDIIFLCVKPDIYSFVLDEIKEYVNEHQLLISVIVGITLEDMGSHFLQPKKIIRTMPNVAVTVGEGMTAVTPNDRVEEEELNLAITLLSSIGKVDVIKESLMDVATSISGCSPAFVAMFVEALADGGVLQGMPRDKAYQYAAQTLIGTAKMILENEIHPGKLKDTVTSPGGVTIEGVSVLEKRGFRGIVIEAMEACGRKIKLLKK